MITIQRARGVPSYIFQCKLPKEMINDCVVGSVVDEHVPARRQGRECAISVLPSNMKPRIMGAAACGNLMAIVTTSMHSDSVPRSRLLFRPTVIGRAQHPCSGFIDNPHSFWGK